MTPLVLAVIAVLLAGPVPAGLARLSWVRRTPIAALVLWQSVAAAAVLAALGAGLSLVTHHAWRGTSELTQWAVAAASLGLTVLVAARLLLSAHRVGTSLRAIRRRHSDQLDLVARAGGRVHIIEHEVPVAYCIPGFGHQRIVVSEGARGVLSPEELDAVLEHERAHLRARHDLVLEAFSALREAFPRWVSSDAALREVRLLVEVLADRVAVRVSGRHALGRALVQLAEGRAPEAALGAGGNGLLTRVELLADTRARPVQAAGLVTLAVGVLVLPTAFVVVPWLTALF
ncbi:M56 family metallopeptidase [Nocardioides alcanivorans]|uniref:M56 family metallopeptidase n=1 Tax=Nocardioides alcanivorans TaxID=2897352 RepID=UPI001F43E51D|nr:M56 family metallopeptidase [Nocardioides alcanivorans]